MTELNALQSGYLKKYVTAYFQLPVSERLPPFALLQRAEQTLHISFYTYLIQNYEAFDD